MTESPMPTTRPRLVVLLCFLCLVRAFVNMMLIAFPVGGKATEEIPVLSILTMGWLVIMFGFWMMRRWGLYVLVAHLAIFVAVHRSVLTFRDPSFLFYAVGLTAGLLYYRRMT